MSRPWRFAVAAAHVLFALVFTAGLYLYLLGLTPPAPAMSVPEFAMPAPTDAPHREDRVVPPPAATQPPAVETPAPAPPPPPVARGVVTAPSRVAEVQPIATAASAPAAESANVAQSVTVTSKSVREPRRLGPSSRSTSAREQGPPPFARAAQPTTPSRRA